MLLSTHNLATDEFCNAFKSRNKNKQILALTKHRFIINLCYKCFVTEMSLTILSKCISKHIRKINSIMVTMFHRAYASTKWRLF